ncbi:BnaAnng17760D [Brassica napus]|uniref:BnaAnng17760D protein n=1 Tax=Brassica napus TaxID=3708 RepID=A0A078JC69_BRANA|nr:BnaAnng17760D [Brassica napus]
MELSGKSPASSDHNTSKKTVASFVTAKSTGKSTASSAIMVKRNGKAVASSANPMEPNAATDLSSLPSEQVMFFREVSLGPREADLMFRMIHFWDARNPNTKTLIGREMLLIDEEGTAIQGFIPASRVERYELIAGSVYKLINFFGSRSKDQFRVADHSATVSFGIPLCLFLRILRFKYQKIGSGSTPMRSLRPIVTPDLISMVNYVGHMKLVNGQTLTDHIVLDEADIAEKRHLCVHIQTHDGPGGIPSVLLVTTMNPKHIGGTLALTSMSSSRVFMDADVQPSKDYLEWLVSNSEIANRVAAEVVTKPEAVTLEELFSYIKHETSKVAWFECTATIDDVIQGSAWYYISCGGCNSKAVKGPTSLSNAGVGVDHCVPVPDALLETIGQTRKFIVKVSDHNLTSKTQTITVTKIIPAGAPLPSVSDGISKTRGDDSGPSGGVGGDAGDRARKAAEYLESDEAKRSKSG